MKIEQLRAVPLQQRHGAPRRLFGAYAVQLLVEAAQIGGGQILGVTQDAKRTDVAFELAIERDAHGAHALEVPLFERVALLAREHDGHHRRECEHRQDRGEDEQDEVRTEPHALPIIAPLTRATHPP